MNRSSQSGAVSIFIVVFTALLVTIVTTSFIQIMLHNQEQASNNDLSQSAYDSALAGVEDAKRALVKLKNCEQSSAACASQVRQALNDKTCDSLQRAGVANFSNGEVMVGDSSLNQAYTCVKVQLDTSDVQGELQADNGSFVTRLQGKRDFNQVRLSWFAEKDLPALPDGTTAAPEYTQNDFTALPSHDAWSNRQPPILRSQLIQFSKGNIDLSSFNDQNTKNAKTLFFYPIENNGSTSTSFSSDTRRDSASRNSPHPVSCKSDFNTTAYLCQVTISLPSIPNREAYLQLAAYYNKASFKVELLDSGSVVPFDGVQPLVDSTGRASDLFRRVKASISVSNGGSQLQFPDAALSLEGNLCKDFFVTNKKDDYQPDTDLIDCDPAASATATP